MEKAERLLKLVALLLDSRHPLPFSQVREQFPEEYGGALESAQRKLERDKSDLLELGVPLQYSAPTDEEPGGYLLDRAQFFLPDPKLLPEEAAALYAAGAAALEARELPFAHDLQLALRKISLTESGRAAGAAARRLLVVRPGETRHLRALSGAVARKKRVHLLYARPPSLDGAAGERTERDVDPWGLAFRNGAWRLIGYCHLRSGQREFVVDRIEEVRVNERLPGTPDFSPPDDFDAGAVAGQKPWLWQSFGDPREVRLRFSDPALERSFEAPSGVLRATSLEGLVPAVLEAGERATVESPAEARALVREALARIVALHAGPPDAVAFLPLDPGPLDPGPAAPAASSRAPLPPADAGEPRPAPLNPDSLSGNAAQKVNSDSEFARLARGAEDAEAAAALPEKRRRVSPLERLRRLLLVVPAARRRPGVLLEELARELQLTPDELREDIELLCFVGRPPFAPDDLIDIEVDERGRVNVRLDQSFSRPPQLLPLEALALAAACEEVAPLDPAVREALRKLTAKLTPAARALYAQLARRVVSTAPIPAGVPAVLEQLRRAAEQHREVALRYARDPARERLFQPQGVVDHAGAWYAIGRDVASGEERTFRADRILAVRETGAHFPDPGPLQASRFQRAQLFFPSGREEPAVLRFSRSAAEWALFRYGDRAHALPDGRAEVWIDSASSRYAISLTMSFAGEAELLAPHETRKALLETAQAALRNHA